MKYDHTKRSDLLDIHDILIDNCTMRQKCLIIERCIAYDLMIPKGFLMWIAMKLCGFKGIPLADFLIKTDDKMVDELFVQILVHMMDGKDTSDSKSAGGFNEDELDKLISCCTCLGVDL